MESFKTHTNATFTAKNGEIVSLNEIIDAINKQVEIYGNTKGRELSADDLDDIRQESLLKAWKYSNSFDPAKASVKTYASRIALNCCIDAMQRFKKEQRIFVSPVVLNRKGEEIDQDALFEYAADGCYAADFEMESEESLDRIDSAIDSLSENQRYILSLKLEGKKPKEMAEEIGCPANVVYTLLCRARKSLGSELGQDFLSQNGIPS